MWRAGHCYWGSIDEQSEGIVVEFAWMLSKRRHLEPYVRLYESLRWDSLVCHSHPLNMFFPGQATSVALIVFDELLKEIERRPRPIVFAAFSGAPKTCMYKLFQILQEKCQELKLDSGRCKLIRECITGQIYDSCPVDFISELGANFVVHPTVLNLSHPPRVLRWGAQATSWVLDALFLNKFEAERAEYWQTLYSSVNMGPILLLCSEDDDLAPFETICNFASHLRELGGDVKLVSWKSSPHVGHYRRYPEEYKSAVKILLIQAASFYSQMMEKTSQHEIMKRPYCIVSNPVCGKEKVTTNSLDKLMREKTHFGTSNLEVQTRHHLGSHTDEQKEELMQIQNSSNRSAQNILAKLHFDIDIPKDIEGWDVEPFSSSLDMADLAVNAHGVSVVVNPFKFTRRCRL